MFSFILKSKQIFFSLLSSSAFKWSKIILTQQSSYSHSCIPTLNLADAHTQNGWLLSLPFLIVLCGCYGNCHPLRWMLFSVLHIFITNLCSGHYWLHSGPGWAEWPAGRQTYSAISQTWQHTERHICRKSSGEYPTRKHKRLSQT